MANNRMFLLHVPTGKAVFLGKRMGDVWYGTPEDVAKHITSLFELVGDSDGKDNYALAMEDSKESEYAFSSWKYENESVDKGIRTLKIEEQK